MNKKRILKSMVGIILSVVLIINISAGTVFAGAGADGFSVMTGGEKTEADAKAAVQSVQKTSTPAEQLPDFDPKKDTKTPSSEEFNVSTYLKLNQAQSYLDSKNSQEGALGKFIVDIIILLTKIIGSFALLVIIAGGITIMISTGNQNLQTKGKEMIKYAIMGLIVAFMSLIIVAFVQSLFYTA